MINNKKDSLEIQELRLLNKRLEVVIALMLRNISRDNKALQLKEQISILDGLGVRPVEIAQIVGKTPKHVGKELVAIRRETKKKK